MTKFLKYSVLRYSPSSVTGEKINLGIVIYDELLKIREFRYTKKYKRISSFDDEVDITAVKSLLQDIKDDVETSIISAEDFDVEEYIKYYNNDFAFDVPKRIEYVNFDEAIERLYKIYFRFDFEKKDRPSKVEDVKLMEELIKAKSIGYKKNQYLIGEFNEQLKYDFVTQDYKIKVFDFDNKDLTKLFNSVKAWSFNTLYSGDSKKTIFVYRYTDDKNSENQWFSSLLDILNKSKAEVYNIDDNMHILQRIS